MLKGYTQALKVGSILTISGTSSPSNATRTNRQVAVNFNGAGYHKFIVIYCIVYHSLSTYEGSTCSSDENLGEHIIYIGCNLPGKLVRSLPILHERTLEYFCYGFK